MKINKVSDENIAPSWAFDSKSLDNYGQKNAISKSEVERLNISAPSKVTERVLAKECEAIEKCATGGKTYHYNSNWSEKDVSHLKEYASTCGMGSDKMKGVDPAIIAKDISDIEKKVALSCIVKTATADSNIKIAKKEKIEFSLPDPFHLEERTNTSHMDKQDWQKVEKQANLSESPSMASGAIKSVRGGENYFANSESKNAVNQNSITNPDVIKNLAESSTLDTGERLRQERNAREKAKETATKEWEKEIISSMTKKDIIPHGRVFPTESMHAQSGLNNPSSQMGVFAKFTKEDIPEKTKGEMIKEINQNYKQSIQREAKEKEDFKPIKATVRGISDTFSEELKKKLKL